MPRKCRTRGPPIATTSPARTYVSTALLVLQLTKCVRPATHASRAPPGDRRGFPHPCAARRPSSTGRRAVTDTKASGGRWKSCFETCIQSPIVGGVIIFTNNVVIVRPESEPPGHSSQSPRRNPLAPGRHGLNPVAFEAGNDGPRYGLIEVSGRRAGSVIPKARSHEERPAQGRRIGGSEGDRYATIRTIRRRCSRSRSNAPCW
jgi:hypothetical protein